jgi:hypothetical protein
MFDDAHDLPWRKIGLKAFDDDLYNLPVPRIVFLWT